MITSYESKKGELPAANIRLLSCFLDKITDMAYKTPVAVLCMQMVFSWSVSFSTNDFLKLYSINIYNFSYPHSSVTGVRPVDPYSNLLSLTLHYAQSVRYTDGRSLPGPQILQPSGKNCTSNKHSFWNTSMKTHIIRPATLNSCTLIVLVIHPLLNYNSGLHWYFLIHWYHPTNWWKL